MVARSNLWGCIVLFNWSPIELLRIQVWSLISLASYYRSKSNEFSHWKQLESDMLFCLNSVYMIHLKRDKALLVQIIAHSKFLVWSCLVGSFVECMLNMDSWQNSSLSNHLEVKEMIISWWNSYLIRYLFIYIEKLFNLLRLDPVHQKYY